MRVKPRHLYGSPHGSGSARALLYDFEVSRKIWRPSRMAFAVRGYALDEEKLSTPPKKGRRSGTGVVVHWEMVAKFQFLR